MEKDQLRKEMAASAQKLKDKERELNRAMEERNSLLKRMQQVQSSEEALKHNQLTTDYDISKLKVRPATLREIKEISQHSSAFWKGGGVKPGEF